MPAAKLASIAAVIVGLFALDSLRSQFQVQLGNGYYAKLDISLKGDLLKNALQEVIKDQTVLSYKEVWAALEDIDRGQGECSPSTIHDVYTGTCWLPRDQRCSKATASEGDCFNREHIWPKSWYGGFESGGGAETDLFSLFAVDGYVNRQRWNFPYGEVVNATFSSKSGAKVGPCTHRALVTAGSSRVRGRVKWFSEAKGYGFVEVPRSADAFVHASEVQDGRTLHKGQAVEMDLTQGKPGKGPRGVGVRSVVDTCFEPPDAVKGDLARVMFYVSVRYRGKLGCCKTDAVDAHRLNKWLEGVLRRWHAEDAVDAAELRRNELIFSRWQHNRNPFVDHPHLVDRIPDF